ncbi:MAG: parallel beta-helix domain-containing protein [Myxococcota bacterium]|nr:parallel beta-helix domain-containing protein [Myxococcota bacterium]
MRPIYTLGFLPVLALLFLSVPSACSPGSETTPPPCTLSVALSDSPRESLQTALIEVAPGGVLCLEEGTWELDLELTLDVEDVTLRGAGQDRTVLDFAPQVAGANGLQVTSSGVVLEDFTVMNTPGDGIRVIGASGIVFRRVTVGWDAVASIENGAYGIYPVQSSEVVVEDCTVYGSRDAGIYVGQSSEITVTRNELYGNVAGIEIENSTDAVVFDNHAHDNTSGILVFNLPDLPVQGGSRTTVRDNLVENNNLANFAEPGTIVAEVPAGLGVMVLATDDTVIRDNRITGNKTAGVLVVSYTDLTIGAQDDPDFDPWSARTCVGGNTLRNNGHDPEGTLAVLVPVVPMPDIVWDGCPGWSSEAISLWDNTVDEDGSPDFVDAALPPCGDNSEPAAVISDVTFQCGS